MATVLIVVVSWTFLSAAAWLSYQFSNPTCLPLQPASGLCLPSRHWHDVHCTVGGGTQRLNEKSVTDRHACCVSHNTWLTACTTAYTEHTAAVTLQQLITFTSDKSFPHPVPSAKQVHLYCQCQIDPTSHLVYYLCKQFANEFMGSTPSFKSS